MHVLAFAIGLLIVAETFLSAARTFVLPRSDSVRLTRIIFLSMRQLFNLIMKLMPTYKQKDQLMALYAPLTLLIMVPTWLFTTTIGYTLIFWAMGIEPLTDAFILSGSSILTLGFSTADTLPQTIMAFTEATIGLILVAMLISYLPTMYSAFSKRETAVSLLEVRAGSPPTAAELIWRQYSLGNINNMESLWEMWEMWFTEIDESHTSLAALVFFRSPQPHLSWVNASATILDAAALMLAVVDTTFNPYPALVLRSGNQALRHIADFFRVSYNPDPHFPQDPIHVSREKFDEAYDRLARQGVPVKPDREQAWHNFAGWRVNYDNVLQALGHLTMAPTHEWLSEYTFVPVDPSKGETGGRIEKVQ